MKRLPVEKFNAALAAAGLQKKVKSATVEDEKIVIVYYDTNLNPEGKRENCTENYYLENDGHYSHGFDCGFGFNLRKREKGTLDGYLKTFHKNSTDKVLYDTLKQLGCTVEDLTIRKITAEPIFDDVDVEPVEQKKLKIKPKTFLSLQEKLLLRLLKRHNIGKNNPIDFGDDGPSICQTFASCKYEFHYFFKVFKVWHEGKHIKAEILETHQNDGYYDTYADEYQDPPTIDVYDIHDYDEGDLNELPEIRDWQVISLLFALGKRFDELPEYTLVSIEEKESYDRSHDYDLQNTGKDPHDGFIVHILGYLYHNGEQWSLNETSGIRIPYKEFADGYAAKGNEYIEELFDGSKQHINNLGDTETACNCLLKAFDGKCADDIKQFKNFTYKIRTTRGHISEDNKYYNEKHKYVRHKLWHGNYLILDKGLAA